MSLSKDVFMSMAEELGILAEVPPAWIKLLTSRGAGDKSELVKISNGLKSTRELSSLVKGREGEWAGFYMTKTDGAPIGIIRYTGEGGKPWQMITPSGEAITRKVHTDRRMPSWKIPTQYLTMPDGSRGAAYKPYKREYSSYDSKDVSLNDLTHKIPWAEGVQLYGLKIDTERAALHKQRQDTRAGQDSDLDTIKKGAAGRFIAAKGGGALDALKAKVTAMADKVKEKLAQVVAAATTGEYNGIGGSRFGRRDNDLLDPKQAEELNSMLYDLSSLSSQMRRAADSGVRRGSSYSKGDTYEYGFFKDKLAQIQAKLDKIGAGGAYENLVQDILKHVVENFGPLGSPQRGSQRNELKDPVLQKVCDYDKLLTGISDEWDTRIEEIMDSDGVENFTDLCEIDPGAIDKLCRFGADCAEKMGLSLEPTEKPHSGQLGYRNPGLDPSVEADEPESFRKGYNVGEGKHKPGCKCGFCKNKGSFGKKKKEENPEPEKETAVEALLKSCLGEVKSFNPYAGVNFLNSKKTVACPSCKKNVNSLELTEPENQADWDANNSCCPHCGGLISNDLFD